MFNWLFRRQASRRPTAQVEVQTARPAHAMSQERRHRDDVPYALPKDLEEGQRLNLQHYIFRYVLRGNYVAPLSEPISAILDVGSGTGIWGQEMAQAFPSARVFGLDLEPPQTVSLAASASAFPANYHFVQGNLLEGLPFPDGIFDYTHQRMLVLGIPFQRWPDALRELKRVTRRGGWVELLELGTEILPAGAATATLVRWSTSFLRSRGLDSPSIKHLGGMLIQQGLRAVVNRSLDLPVGSWDRHLGILMERDVVAAFQAIRSPTCAAEGIQPAEFDIYLQQAMQEWKNLRATCRFYLAYGQV
ncbi:MAG TPA: methyltransferase domain-containing protein [Ktedonobacteraceae bacterium]